MLTAVSILTFAFAASAQTAFVQQAKLLAADGAAQDSHGFSVAISGDTAVVGAPRNSGGTGLQSRGSVYVYVRNDAGVWTPQQKLAPSDGVTTDQFGYAVAVNGNTIAVGRYNTTTGQNRGDGKVYIFTRTGTSWTETQTLVSNDIAQGDLFGNSLAFENDTLVVGALNKTNGANFFQGAAYIFTRTGGAGNFTQQAKLTASDGVFADFFGYSVAISGDSVLVGATSLAGQPNSKGKAYVFTRSGTTWTEQAILQASDGVNGDAFGFAVGISGATAVVGARLDDVGATADQGSAYVFTRTGTTWTQTQQLFGVETTQRNDTFGGSVAINGDLIAVGAPAHEFVGSIANHGAIYVFRRDAADGVFSRTEKLLQNDPAPDALGTSVAFDGTSIVAGAPSKDSARGAAYIFNQVATNGQSKLIGGDQGGFIQSGNRTVAISADTALMGNLNFGTSLFQRSGSSWQFVRKLTATVAGGDTAPFTNAGAAILGDVMAVGSPTSRVNNVNGAGAVYIFNRVAGNWTDVQRLLPPDTAAGQCFGCAIAMTANTLVVGTENKDEGANLRQGAVYVYVLSGGTWTFQQKLTASDGAAQDNFGQSVAISGDTLIVGAPMDDVGAVTNQGSAYIFTRTGTTWTQQPKVTSADGADSDRFGRSVAIDDETAIVSAPGADSETAFSAGAVYTFNRTGATYSQSQKFYSPETESFIFGDSIALSGGRLVVGAPRSNDPTRDLSGNGAIYVYQRSGTTFNRRGRLLAFDRASSDQLGSFVGIADNYVIGGSPGSDAYGFSSIGAAYVFDLNAVSFTSPGFDFDGDGKADLSVFRPSERNWYLSLSTAGFGAVQFGLASDKFAPADYDGDGKTDIAVWREGANGRFYILQSSNGAVREEDFGIAGDNPSFTGDWDGDGKADLAVYRGSTNHFYYRGSLDNPSGDITYLAWGISEDKPMRGDFDGDGKMDAAVFRPSSGVWYIRQSSNGQIRYENWGIATDRFVPADYDGDGKTDLAVFRSGTWYIKQSSNNTARYENFGVVGDALAPADYDGDGKADLAVFRSGVWYILQSSNSQFVYKYFGAAGDSSIPSAFVQ